MSKTVYITGHRNPDTDSVCSALAYAYLKNTLGQKAEALRSGNINAETRYALDFFGVPAPRFINDFYPRAKDIMLAAPPHVKPDDTIFTLASIMQSSKIKSIPVIDDGGKFIGIISIGDLAKRFLAEMTSLNFSGTGTTFASIAKVLSGQILAGRKNLDTKVNGKLKIAGSSIETSRAAYTKGDIVLVGDRTEIHRICLDIKVAGMIITGETCTLDESFLKEADDAGIVIIHCRYDTYTTARLMNQSIPVSAIMETKLVTFSPSDLIDEIKSEITKHHYRNYPVVEKGHLLGIINRNSVIMPQKQPVILVDHNELSQAIEGLEYVQIKEIIDHHRLGGLKTNEPIFIFQQPVGCTATIIASLYKQHSVDIPRDMAGLLLSAILSDTVIFKSPTTTPQDREVAAELAKTAQVDIDTYGLDLLRAGASLTRNKPDALIRQDMKEVHLGNMKLSISQVYTLDEKELPMLKGLLCQALDDMRQKENYNMSLLIVTNILSASSDLLVSGEPQRLIEYAFKKQLSDGAYHLPGVMSRKKQIIPPLAAVIEELQQ